MSELTEVSKRLDELTKRFDLFLDAHEEKSKMKDKLVMAIIEKTAAGAFWALLVFLCKSVWDNLPLFGKGHS